MTIVPFNRRWCSGSFVFGIFWGWGGEGDWLHVGWAEWGECIESLEGLPETQAHLVLMVILQPKVSDSCERIRCARVAVVK